MDYEAIRRKYDKKNIGRIEIECSRKGEISMATRIQQIEILIYLQRTGRFKENKRYAGSTFYRYLTDRFNILPGTFEKERRAILGYPEEVRVHGLGLVAKIQERCRQPEKVFEEIKRFQDARKNPVKREQIEDIIVAHSKPIKLLPPQPPLPTRSELSGLQEENKRLKELLAERDEQIAKLKAALQKYKLIYQRMTKIVEKGEEPRAIAS